MTEKILFFKPCPLTEGQKIRIEDSYLKGDWEIIKITDYKITIKCPFSGKELVKDYPFFFTREEEGPWPMDE